MTEKMLNEYGIKMNNEQSLFKNKMCLTKNNIHIKPKILFRNDALNHVINGIKNSQSENKIFTEEKYKYKNKSNKSINNRNLNSFKKTNKLKLPSLSEKFIKIKNFLNINNRKNEEKIFNNHMINADDKRKRYIENIMQSCCSVTKMNIPQKKAISNRECFLCYKLKNKDDNYKPIFLYKNKNNKIKNIMNRYKRVSNLPSTSSFKKKIKILVSEETMTNYKSIKNETNKNNDNNVNHLISNKKFHKYNLKKHNLHLNTYNFNYDYYNNIKD